MDEAAAPVGKATLEVWDKMELAIKDDTPETAPIITIRSIETSISQSFRETRKAGRKGGLTVRAQTGL